MWGELGSRAGYVPKDNIKRFYIVDSFEGLLYVAWGGTARDRSDCIVFYK